MKRILTCLPLLFTSISLLIAQEEGGDVKKAPAGRMAWLVATTIPEDLENPVDVMTGKEIKKVSLSKRMTSEPVKIPADGIIRLVRKIEKPEDQTKPPYVTLAEARISDSVNNALIILVPASRKDRELPLFNTKVQDLASFRGGDYMYLNLTNLKIAVQMGDKKLGVKPGEVMIHSAGVAEKAVSTPIAYYIFNPDEEDWKLLSASTVVMQPTRREICIFSWDPNYNRVDYHGVTFPVTTQAADN